MNFTIDRDATGYQVKIEGDLDLYTSYAIKDEIKERIIPVPDHMHVDLSQVHYIDSAGIGLLIELKKNIEKLGKTYTVSNISDEQMKMFRSISLDLILGESLKQ